MEWIIGITLWLGCGYITVGLAFGYELQAFPLIALDNRGMSAIMHLFLFLLGPLSMISVVLNCINELQWASPIFGRYKSEYEAAKREHEKCGWLFIFEEKYGHLPVPK